MIPRNPLDQTKGLPYHEGLQDWRPLEVHDFIDMLMYPFLHLPGPLPIFVDLVGGKHGGELGPKSSLVLIAESRLHPKRVKMELSTSSTWLRIVDDGTQGLVHELKDNSSVSEDNEVGCNRMCWNSRRLSAFQALDYLLGSGCGISRKDIRRVEPGPISLLRFDASNGLNIFHHLVLRCSAGGSPISQAVLLQETRVEYDVDVLLGGDREAVFWGSMSSVGEEVIADFVPKVYLHRTNAIKGN